MKNQLTSAYNIWIVQLGDMLIIILHLWSSNIFLIIDNNRLCYAGSGYQTGVNYDRLRDELGQARELQEVGPPTLRNGPDNSKKDDLLYFSL